MRHTIKQAYQSPFLRQNAVFFIGSMIVAALNYFYYPVLGRLLPTEAFGELQVLVSLATQAAILLQVFSLVATNIVVNEPDPRKTNAILTELQKLSLWVCGGLTALMALLAPLLQQALKFESFWPFIIVGLTILFTVPATYTGAFLRAKKDFKAASVTQAVGAVAKLALSAALVYAGMRALGAITGYMLSQIVAMLYTAYRARKHGYQFIKSGRGINASIVKPHLKYAAFVLVTSLITTGLVTIDSIAVKYYLSPAEAGLYGGISTVARIIFFLTGSVGMVLLSSVKIGQEPKLNRQLLQKSFLLTVTLGGGALLIFALLPNLVIHVLMGGRYDAYAHYLPLLSVAILLISLSQLLSQYHVALRHYAIAWPLLVGASTAALAVGLHHNGIGEIITSLLLGSAVLLAGLLAMTAYRARSLWR